VAMGSMLWLLYSVFNLLFAGELDADHILSSVDGRAERGSWVFLGSLIPRARQGRAPFQTTAAGSYPLSCSPLPSGEGAHRQAFPIMTFRSASSFPNLA
jgi:hypothetical protein